VAEKPRLLAARWLTPTFVATNSRRATSPISMVMTGTPSKFVVPDPAGCRAGAVNFLEQHPDDEEDQNGLDQEGNEQAAKTMATPPDTRSEGLPAVA
jgi:hypothetical protein